MSTKFKWSSEQVELRAAVRAFCERVSPESEVRRLMESSLGHDPVVWSRLGSELGVLGLATPEEYGGGGDGFVSQAIVAEEFGRALLCGPTLGSIALAATALGQLEDDARKEYLPGIVAGATVAAFVAPIHRGRFDPSNLAVTATGGDGDSWTLSGMVTHVVDAPAAELFVVAATTNESRPALFVVPAGRAGLVVESVSALDLTRRQGTVSFNTTPARLVATGDVATRVCERTQDVAAVLLAAEQVGAAQHLLDLTVGYARTRLQFGRPIGSFQAVKHICADMLVDVEQARSTAYHAAWALDDGSDDPHVAASLAKSVCSDAFSRVAAATIQVHGGIGFTWEHRAHLYYKRAVTDAALLGSATDHRERLAELVLD